MAGDETLISKTALEIVRLLKCEDISPLDLLDTLEDRIGKVDKHVNSLPTLCFDRARDHAKSLMKRSVEDRGLLAGFPVAITDLDPVAGVRTTWGSPIYKDFVPKRSDCLVEILEENGGIVYAKSNTPEFGAGANTFNEVFGKTVNPWSVKLSAGGSSGGAAAAVASEMAFIAQGSDFACSVIILSPDL